MAEEPQIRSVRRTEPRPITAAEPRQRPGISLRARVIAGYVVMLVLLLLVFGAVLGQLGQLRSDLALLSEGYLPLAQEIAGVASWSPQTDSQPGMIERLYRERRVDAWIFKRIEGHLERSRLITEAMLGEPLRDDDRASIEPIRAQVILALKVADEIQDTHALFVAAVENAPASAVEMDLEQDADDPGVYVPRLLDLERQLDINLRILTKRISRRISRVVDRTRAAHRDAVVFAGAVSAVAFVVAILLLLNTHFALRPIRRLIAGAEHIREGSFAERVPVETRDEIGRLARSFNSMAASLEERERALERRTEQLEEALADLRATQDRVIRTERLAAIGHMAAQIAHEVRNPLNALGLNADLLGEEISEGNTDDAAEILGAIQNEVRRLTEITEAYLSVGRLPPLRLEVQPLAPIIEELVRFQAEELGIALVEVSLDLPALPEVHVDADQLRQALLNILRNAVEALAEHGGGAVRISAAMEGAWVLIEIADDGPGMAAEHVSRIFDPFYSTKSTGSGLGLPLTQQVVGEHGGRIACISSPGEGTTFSIRLPVASPPEPDSA
ncbi:MAG: HAMP domain-containing protein [Deltaproteobacteria bacterium]|nr:HAMP domain-containing protein [Deltaproteobacteria bacterium]